MFIYYSRGGHPTSVPNWINLTQQNLTKAGEQLSGSFHLRFVKLEILHLKCIQQIEFVIAVQQK